MIVVADPRTLVHSRRWAAWLSWVEKAGAVPGDRNWRMPSRPSRYRDASSDESDEDAMGRRIAKRRGDDDSDSDEERAQVAAQAKRRAAVRQEQRRKDRAERAAARAAEKAASGEADDEEDEGGQLAEEAKWREALLQQAKAADAEYEAAFAAQVERERRAAEARARGELTEEEKEERQAAEAAAAAAKARALEAKELPFAFVALPPTPYSPAEDAGLLAGDAILRFGAPPARAAAPRTQPCSPTHPSLQPHSPSPAAPCPCAKRLRPHVPQARRSSSTRCPRRSGRACGSPSWWSRPPGGSSRSTSCLACGTSATLTRCSAARLAPTRTRTPI
jgi:hypothetical protein